MTRFVDGPLAGTEKELAETSWICSTHDRADACHGIIAHCALLATAYSDRRQCWLHVWVRYDVFIKTSRYGPGVAEAAFVEQYITLHTHDACNAKCRCGREPGF